MKNRSFWKQLIVNLLPRMVMSELIHFWPEYPGPFTVLGGAVKVAPLVLFSLLLSNCLACCCFMQSQSMEANWGVNVPLLISWQTTEAHHSNWIRTATRYLVLLQNWQPTPQNNPLTPKERIHVTKKNKTNESSPLKRQQPCFINWRVVSWSVKKTTQCLRLKQRTSTNNRSNYVHCMSPITWSYLSNSEQEG